MLMLVSHVAFTMVAAIMATFGLITPRCLPVGEAVEAAHSLLELVSLFVLNCLFAPLFEELAFRLPLKVNKRNIIWGLSFFVTTCITLFTTVEDLTRPYLWKFNYPVVFASISWACFLLITQIIAFSKPLVGWSFTKPSPKWLVLLSCLLFAAIHVKVSPTTEYWFLYPIIYSRLFVQ